MTWMLLALLFSPPILINSYISFHYCELCCFRMFLAKSKILKPQFDSQLFNMVSIFDCRGILSLFYYSDSTAI